MEKEGGRIVGIKAIADYLDASERSVYRWEKELGLPLHRVSGSAGSSVYVYIDELEEWLKKRESAEKALVQSKKSRVLFVFILTAALLIIVVVLFFLKSGQILFKFEIPNPVTSTVRDNMVIVKDAKGKDVWTYITYFEKVDIETWWRRQSLDFQDIDKDGTNEVACRVYKPVEDKFWLTLFDNDGTVVWEKSITNQQTYNGLHLKSHFIPISIKFAKQKDGQIFIVTYWRHKVRFLSFITSHDLEGNLIHKYIHTGHLGSLEVFDLDLDGTDEILFGGTNNLLSGEGILGVLDLSDFRGVCPPYRIEPEYSHSTYRLEKYVPDNPERGNQMLYLRFKRMPHFDDKQQTYIFAVLHDLDEGLIHAQMFPFDLEHQDQLCSFEFIFNRNFDLLYMIPDSLMIRIYPEISRDLGKRLTLKEMVEDYSKSVFRWEGGSWVPVSQPLG